MELNKHGMPIQRYLLDAEEIKTQSVKIFTREQACFIAEEIYKPMLNEIEKLKKEIERIDLVEHRRLGLGFGPPCR